VLAKSLLLASLVAQGTPAFNAPTLENPELRRFVGCCVELRKRFQLLLAPPMFDSPRDIRCVAGPCWCSLLLHVAIMLGSTVLYLLVRQQHVYVRLTRLMVACILCPTWGGATGGHSDNRNTADTVDMLLQVAWRG
jgi:hypothetical protein